MHTYYEWLHIKSISIDADVVDAFFAGTLAEISVARHPVVLPAYTSLYKEQPTMCCPAVPQCTYCLLINDEG